MIFNALVALASGFMTIHNANQIKEDYKTPYEDCKVWGFEDGSWASKARWGSKIGLDSLQTASSGLIFVDSVSGGAIRTKAIREFFGGVDSSEDLKDKISKIESEVLGKPEPIKKENVVINPVVETPKLTDNFVNENSDKTIDVTISSEPEKEYNSNMVCVDNNREEASSEASSESSIEDSSSDSSVEDSSEFESEQSAPIVYTEVTPV
jgi:hypothetical protein